MPRKDLKCNCTRAFQLASSKLKCTLSSDVLLCHFDPNKRITVAVEG